MLTVSSKFHSDNVYVVVTNLHFCDIIELLSSLIKSLKLFNWNDFLLVNILCTTRNRAINNSDTYRQFAPIVVFEVDFEV